MAYLRRRRVNYGNEMVARPTPSSECRREPLCFGSLRVLASGSGQLSFLCGLCAGFYSAHWFARLRVPVRLPLSSLCRLLALIGQSEPSERDVCGRMRLVRSVLLGFAFERTITGSNQIGLDRIGSDRIKSVRFCSGARKCSLGSHNCRSQQLRRLAGCNLLQSALLRAQQFAWAKLRCFVHFEVASLESGRQQRQR